MSEKLAILEYQKKLEQLCKYSRVDDKDLIIDAFIDSINELDLQTQDLDYQQLVHILGSPTEFIEYYLSMNDDVEPNIRRKDTISRQVELWVERTTQKPKFYNNNQKLLLILFFIPLLLEVINIYEKTQNYLRYPIIEPISFFIVTIIAYELITGLFGYYPLNQRYHVIYSTSIRLLLFLGLFVAASKAYLVNYPMYNAINQYLGVIITYEFLKMIKEVIPILLNYHRGHLFILLKNSIFLSAALIWSRFGLFVIRTPQENPNFYSLLPIIGILYVLSSILEYRIIKEEPENYIQSDSLRETIRRVQSFIAVKLYPRRIRMAYVFFAFALFNLMNLLRPEVISDNYWIRTYIYRSLEFIIPGTIVLIVENGRQIGKKFDNNQISQIFEILYTYTPVIFVTQGLLLIFGPIEFIYINTVFERPANASFLRYIFLIAISLIALSYSYFIVADENETSNSTNFWEEFRFRMKISSVLVIFTASTLLISFINDFFFIRDNSEDVKYEFDNQDTIVSILTLCVLIGSLVFTSIMKSLTIIKAETK